MSKTRTQYVETAVRPLYAVAGATDLAVELARGYVAEAQVKVNGAQRKAGSRVTDVEPRTLPNKAVDLARSGVDELANQAKARQARIEKRVTDIQDQAKALPTKVESYVNGTVADLSETYSELADRGEQLVGRIRNQQSTQDAVAAVKSTESKAKATRTTAKKGVAATKSRAKATRTTAKKQAEKTANTVEATAVDSAEKGAKATRSPARATVTTARKRTAATKTAAKSTVTAAKKAAEATTEAVTEAAEKVGD